MTPFCCQNLLDLDSECIIHVFKRLGTGKAWAHAAQSNLYSHCTAALDRVDGDISTEERHDSLQMCLSKHGQHVSSIRLTGGSRYMGTPHAPWSSGQWCNMDWVSQVRGRVVHKARKSAKRPYLASLRQIASPARPSCISLTNMYVQLGPGSRYPEC